ncbi:unnamed protein product, partial [Sphacelaria rigidula]
CFDHKRCGRHDHSEAADMGMASCWNLEPLLTSISCHCVARETLVTSVVYLSQVCSLLSSLLFVFDSPHNGIQCWMKHCVLESSQVRIDAPAPSIHRLRLP